MPRVFLLSALALCLAVLGGCDSTPDVCPDGDLDTTDVVVGAGSPEATTGSTVILSYTGRLSNGNEFDSGADVRFELPRTILGFRLGVAGMRPGGRRTITIPPNLGYGPNPLPRIPACSTLIFDVQLRDIVS